MIFLFHGEDTYTSNQQIKNWKIAFQKKYNSDFPPEIFHYADLNFRQFITDLPSLPFLIEKKLVIVKNFLSESTKEQQQQLQKTLETLPESTVIIFHEQKSADKRLALYKYLKKNGQEKEFPKLSQPETIKWIQQEIPGIPSALALNIYNICGDNLWYLKNEIEKLKLYGKTNQLNKETLVKILTPHPSSSIFKLTDELGSKQTQKALDTFHTLIDSGETPHMVFYMLIGHFRKILQVQSVNTLSPAEMKSRYNIHPFLAQKLIQQNRHFTLQQLTEIHQQFLQIDRQMKSGIIQATTNNQTQLLLAIEKLFLQKFHK